MPYKVTIEADSINELSGKILALAAQLQGTSDAPAAADPKPAPKAKDEKPKADDKPKEDPKPKVDEKPKEEPAAESGAVTDFPAKAREAVLAFVSKKSREDLEAILAEFGVAKVTQVKEDQQAEILERLRLED